MKYKHSREDVAKTLDEYVARGGMIWFEKIKSYLLAKSEVKCDCRYHPSCCEHCNNHFVDEIIVTHPKPEVKCENCEMKPNALIRVKDISANPQECIDCGRKLYVVHPKPKEIELIHKLSSHNILMDDWTQRTNVEDKVNELVEALNKHLTSKGI